MNASPTAAYRQRVIRPSPSRESRAAMSFPRSTTCCRLSMAAAMIALAATPMTVMANPLVSPIIPWPVSDDRWLFAWGAGVGLIEAPIVRAVTRASWARCLVFGLVANFLSSLVGWWRPMHTLHGFVWSQLDRGMPMDAAQLVSLLLTCWAVALIVETPLVWAACGCKRGLVKRAILGSLAAQTVSYAILAPITLLIVR